MFAGHGDIQGGKGFLDLPDGAFTADDLEAMLKTVPATHAHVILDSCNSFFVVNSRKPGGRHFVTSEEASKSLSARLPNVGVFLSTSAEAEVFEWSELQSGVFSHAVRSGLAGAADVNRDGQVSYDELRAFVDIASKDVRNPAYRPQVFARGPSGKGDTSLLDLTKAQGTRVRFDDSRRRVTVRDANELPWFDFHKEAGEAATLVLPSRVAAGGSIEEPGGTGKLRRVLESPAATEIVLAALTPTPVPRDARGGDDLFRSLFARPFGSLAFAAAIAAEGTVPELVLGVSEDERERMRLLLGESADAARRTRLVRGSLSLATDLGVSAIGGVLLADGIKERDGGAIVASGVVVAFGTYLSVRSLLLMAGPSLEEETLEGFTRGTANGATTQQAYALAERRLLYAAEQDRRRRRFGRWVGLLGMTVEGAGLGISLYKSNDPAAFFGTPASIALFGGLTVLGTGLFIESLFPSTTERMAELWKQDPSRLRSTPTSAFTLRPQLGLGGAGLTGTW